MKQKILITGASGFIGSFLVDEALRLGYAVTAAVRPSSSREFLTHPDIRFMTLEYASTELLKKQLQGEAFDYVIHCAGTTGTKGSGDFETVNFVYTRNLADALMAAATPLKRFIYVSTLAVNGPGDSMTMKPIKPGDAEKPITAYAESKLKAERYLSSLGNFPCVIVRPTAVYGPRDRDFLSLFKWIRKGLEPNIGWHRQLLSMIYVKDFAVATLALLQLPTPGRLYFASDGRSYEKEDISRYIRLILNKTAIPVRIPLVLLSGILAVSDVLHHLAGKHPFLSREKLKEVAASNWLCDSSALWKDLSIQPVYLLEDGIRETAEWYRNHGWL
ncbi:MAG: NAD(P)-dependent oxidoreductase [Cyclobacteriaceae bacterium]|nr:NAD(P)-dependent oxidoreductase [Cyclobacteriaceae bacterium]